MTFKKTFQKVGIVETFLNIMKVIYDKPQLTLYALVKEQSFPSKIRSKTRVSTLTTTFST